MRQTLTIAGAVALGVALWSTPAAAQSRPVVVELFTSQGCSSCPPADKILGELARRGDVLALGFHVDYWDNLGWKDPFSRQSSTERQFAYAKRFGRRQVYTPQIVIDGTGEAVGSHADEVLAAVRAVSPTAAAPIAFAADRRSVTIGAAAVRGDPGKADILLVRFVLRRTTRVAAGENARRTLDDTNAVAGLATLGHWDGGERRFAIDPPAEGEGVAVLVQAADGRILGAAALLDSRAAG